MSNASNEKQSDLQQAAQQADAEQIQENLSQDNSAESANKPKQLSEDEKTPFMDDESRTDK